jgi:ferredoxin-fold anticodon binding domain-containing protein
MEIQEEICRAKDDKKLRRFWRNEKEKHYNDVSTLHHQMLSAQHLLVGRLLHKVLDISLSQVFFYHVFTGES